MSDGAVQSGELGYRPGLDRISEPVISSHFMHRLASDLRLQLYSEQQFRAKALVLDDQMLYACLIPAMLHVSGDFSRRRAAAAIRRAQEQFARFGVCGIRHLSTAHYITEALFDRQFLRNPSVHCSRETIRQQVQSCIDASAPIEMLIPALPYKFPSPLKTRGRFPDFAEVNFLLSLFEVAKTIELLYRAAAPDLPGPLAKFKVVSDGSRFCDLMRENPEWIRCYREHLTRWVERLGLAEYISIVDYTELMREKLPSAIWQEKELIRENARKQYADSLQPVFDPCDMSATMSLAVRIEPDPETANPEGRFVSLLKSLVYTIDYVSLREYRSCPEVYLSLYRDVTTHIFEPYCALSGDEWLPTVSRVRHHGRTAFTPPIKEALRRRMLEEVWSAAVEYMAEIRSDRELSHDPMLTCLPGHIRWTIHAKRGQLLLSVPTAPGPPVQAWAGTAMFRRTQRQRFKLCTVPLLALEGEGAIPVFGAKDLLPTESQPLFYVGPDVHFETVQELVETIADSLTRERTT